MSSKTVFSPATSRNRVVRASKMYTWKVRTFSAKDLFSTRPLTDIWKEDKLGKRRSKDKTSPKPRPTSDNQKKVGCLECKKLREALEKHLKSHHGDVSSTADPTFAPKKQRNLYSSWTVRTMGSQEEKKGVTEEKRTENQVKNVGENTDQEGNTEGRSETKEKGTKNHVQKVAQTIDKERNPEKKSATKEKETENYVIKVGKPTDQEENTERKRETKENRTENHVKKVGKITDQEGNTKKSETVEKGTKKQVIEVGKPSDQEGNSDKKSEFEIKGTENHLKTVGKSIDHKGNTERKSETEERRTENHAKKFGKPTDQKGNTKIKVIGKGNKPKRTSEPKMKQLTLLNMLDFLKNRKCGVREIQKAKIEEDSKETDSEDKKVRVAEKHLNVPVPRTAGGSSAFRERGFPVSPKYSIDPTPSKNKEPCSLFFEKPRETKYNGQPPQPIPERDWKPFQREKCGFVPVTDSFGRYPCLWCKKTFSRPYNLSRHALKHKENKNKQRFTCAECGKKFDRKDGLQKHHLSHKNERPHVCGTCRRRFKHKNHLNEHQKLNRCFKRQSLHNY